MANGGPLDPVFAVPNKEDFFGTERSLFDPFVDFEAAPKLGNEDEEPPFAKGEYSTPVELDSSDVSNKALFHSRIGANESFFEPSPDASVLMGLSPSVSTPSLVVTAIVVAADARRIPAPVTARPDVDSLSFAKMLEKAPSINSVGLLPLII